MIYFNNAATSYPKPQIVIQAVLDNLKSPPIALYRENKTEDSEVTECRNLIATLFHFPLPQRVIFCSGATEALNIAIHGLIKKKGYVVTTQIEHNSVLRPLRHLEKTGSIHLDIVPCRPLGDVLIEEFKRLLRPETCLVVINHASNVTGFIQNMEDFYEICTSLGIPLLIDASQTAGAVDIDFSEMPKAVLIFTGHKSLLGPRGIGGLLIGDEIDLRVWKTGGTGILSDLETMPDLIPLKYEAGTMNHPGIAGLSAGVKYILEHGVKKLSEKKVGLSVQLWEGLEKLGGVQVYSENPEGNYCGVMSFNIEGQSVREVGYILEESFDIKCRTGLHCAPLIHKALGTFPEGNIRVSFSPFNTHNEVDEFLRALRIIKEMT